MQCHPFDVLATMPDVFWANLRNLPIVADSVRDRSDTHASGGTPYDVKNDLRRLAQRCMT